MYKEFLKYAHEVKKREKEQDEIAFKNSYKPIKQRDESSNNSKKVKPRKTSKNQDLLKFNNRKTQLVQKHIIALDRPELNILYKSGALMFFNSLLLSQSD